MLDGGSSVTGSTKVMQKVQDGGYQMQSASTTAHVYSNSSWEEGKLPQDFKTNLNGCGTRPVIIVDPLVLRDGTV